MSDRAYRVAVVALLTAIAAKLWAGEWIEGTASVTASAIRARAVAEEAPAPGSGGVWGRELDPWPPASAPTK
jgi:hypothetical protein